MGEGEQKEATMTAPAVSPDLIEWLADQKWSSFAQSIVSYWRQKGALTPKQLAAAERMRAMSDAREAAKARDEAEGPVVPPDPGFYLVDGTFYRIQLNQDKSAVYGKVWNERDWEYIGRKCFRACTAETKITAEQAAEFGHQFGRCLRCNSELTDPDSVARGIGPVCATKEGW